MVIAPVKTIFDHIAPYYFAISEKIGDFGFSIPV
jgi:hypothetical protein